MAENILKSSDVNPVPGPDNPPPAPPEAPARQRRQVSVDIPEGQVVVDKTRGYSKTIADQVMNSEWEPCIVRRREVVGLNGTNFYVGGPQNGQPMQSVLLPKPLAEILMEAIKMEASSDAEWRARTDSSIVDPAAGRGTKQVEYR